MPVLSELKAGELAVVRSVDGADEVSLRLLDLGMLPGTGVRVVRRAPLGDPVVYELRGYQLCLRGSEARRIQVEREDVAE